MSVPPVRADMPRGLLMLFAVASGLSVANVYYAQPLLDALALEFAMAPALVGGVVAMTQVGCALALLLVVPLGDVLPRRRLMGIQLALLVGVLVLVGMARSAPMLLVGMLGVGLLGTAMTQGLLAYAASAASAREQGRVIGIAQGGVFIGLLSARAFSGAVSDLAGWRGVYLLAALLMACVAVPLWRRLPRLVDAAAPLGYWRLIASMFWLLRTEPVLQVRGILALLMFAVLNIFWSALALALSAPPFHLAHTVIGAFGLVGVAGALAAARTGRWVDDGYAPRVTVMALVLLLLAWWPLSRMDASLWLLALGIVLLDAGAQALHVTNQSLIVRTHANAHGRLIGLYMLFYAAGSGLGAMGATLAYAHGGWHGVCALGASVSVLALGFGVWTQRMQAGQLIDSARCPQRAPR
ncbi:MFS transporter [Cupriavidus pauculus]|uniref:MFS transporter n=1 Tax=Cupriavidus pauculus TaxID=82633 RepID=UPI001CBD80C8|nr:MFS transporter [Cupriavidus pauculus]MCM3607438.1 MFS transporter [Cupriavidus pauculus]